MPYVSLAQARAMHAKGARGELDPKVVAEFDQATDFARLPERAPKKKRRSSRILDPKR